MDDEIDLRQYIQGLIRRWPLIVGLTLIAAALAAGLSLRQPNQYEAVALISVLAPHLTVQPDGSSVNTVVPAKAYPELAASGDILTQVLTQSVQLLPANSPDRNANLTTLQNQFTAEAAADPSIIRLKVRDTDPDVAALLANQWASVFVARAGALYTQDQANLKVYTSQLAEAKTAMDQAHSDLATFQASNQANILNAQLASQQSALIGALDHQQELESLGQDTRDLVSRLTALPTSGPASPADDLALLTISGRLYGAAVSTVSTNTTSSAPLLLQLQAGQPVAGPTVADQLGLAVGLSDTIKTRLAENSGIVSALEPQILTLQGQLAQASNQENELGQAVQLADDQYTKMATQVQDAALVAQASANTVQVATIAIPPTTKVGPNRGLITAEAAAAGLVLGVLAALGLEYWQSPPVAKTG